MKELDKEYTLGVYKSIINEKCKINNNEFLIISNNSIVNASFENVVMVDGSFIDVLNTVKKYIEDGNTLVTHPLPASIRMMFSPVRSVILKKKDISDSQETNIKSEQDMYLNIITESIDKYKSVLGKRNIDLKNKSDYEKIDYDLTVSAVEENNFINAFKNI